jgi:Fe-S-cluster containining protein
LNDPSADADREAYRQRLDVFLASRDVGQTLTLDALRAGIKLETVVRAAADVARYADEALAIVNDEYRPRLDCREGCSYCCCKPGVLTTIPEFLRILDHMRSTFSAEAADGLADRARRYASQMDGRHFDDLVDHLVPCPLLVDDRCSVYEVRPLVCRGYNSTNVDACREASADAEVTVPIFSVLRDVTDGATVGTAQSLQAIGLRDALVDLGTALNIAVATGDAFESPVVAGDVRLVAAENPSWVTELWSRVCETAGQVGIGINPDTGGDG